MIRYIIVYTYYTFMYIYIYIGSLILKCIISNKQFNQTWPPLLRWSCKLQATLWPKQWLLQRWGCSSILGEDSHGNNGSIVGSGDPRFTPMRIKNDKTTNQSNNSWKKKTETTILQIWVIKQPSRSHTVFSCFGSHSQNPRAHHWTVDGPTGSGLPSPPGHQAPFQGPASNHRAEDGGNRSADDGGGESCGWQIGFGGPP